MLVVGVPPGITAHTSTKKKKGCRSQGVGPSSCVGLRQETLGEKKRGISGPMGGFLTLEE